MFGPGWSVCWVLLVLHKSVCGLEVCGHDKDEVTCSEGLSQCTMADVMSFPIPENEAAEVHKLTPHFRLCCKDKATCTLCLVVELHISMDVEGTGSGADEEDSPAAASVTVCWKTSPTLPICKKVEFMVQPAASPQQTMSMVITEPRDVFFSSDVSVYPSQSLNLTQQVVAPSLSEVCAQEEQRVEECRNLTKLSRVVFLQSRSVELHFTGTNESAVSLCVQNEPSGSCQMLDRATVPLYSVTPCTCLQVWDKDKPFRRVSVCPFKNQESTVDKSIRGLIRGNVWHNVSVSVVHSLMNSYSPTLWWTLSAPCRLEGEVWPCQRETTCREVQGKRQQLGQGTWTQNSKRLWETEGVFEDVDLQRSQCVMVQVQVQVQGLGHELGPFCVHRADRWRWSLLLVAVVLLVCFAGLIVYFSNDFVKNAKSCFQAGFRHIVRQGHVVLLGPPDTDEGLSRSVCQLGSMLRDRGFSVSVDQCSRRQQCTLGPLPWLHSQLMELDSLGGRVVLVLTHGALARAVEWGHEQPLDASLSPYADVFTACLSIVQAEQQQGRAEQRFVLVTFDSQPRGDGNLPELLQGLRLFQLPAQTQALLSELSGRGNVPGFRRTNKPSLI